MVAWCRVCPFPLWHTELSLPLSLLDTDTVCFPTHVVNIGDVVLGQGNTLPITLGYGQVFLNWMERGERKLDVRSPFLASGLVPTLTRLSVCQQMHSVIVTKAWKCMCHPYSYLHQRANISRFSLSNVHLYTNVAMSGLNKGVFQQREMRGHLYFRAM